MRRHATTGAERMAHELRELRAENARLRRRLAAQAEAQTEAQTQREADGTAPARRSAGQRAEDVRSMLRDRASRNP